MKFEEYLQDKHAAQYQGLDDEMPDNFNEWITELSPDEWIEFGEKWVESCLPKVRITPKGGYSNKQDLIECRIEEIENCMALIQDFNFGISEKLDELHKRIVQLKKRIKQ